MREAGSRSPSRRSEFHAVYEEAEEWRDGFYLFLQNIYRLYPEDRFHALIREACSKHADDEAIYRYLQGRLPGIKPFLAPLTYALPSLAKQKAEMARQTTVLLEEKRDFDGYLEIGTVGRYVKSLARHCRIRGPVYLLNDAPPSSSPVDVFERGGLRRVGRFVPLEDYAPVEASRVPDASLDLMTCYIGLHHAAPDRRAAFIASLRRMLRPGGILILRDHDVTGEPMRAFVSLAHTVFNAGLGVPWETNLQERRHFEPVAEWVRLLESAGFRDTGHRVLQANDPTDNTLMAFERGSTA